MTSENDKMKLCVVIILASISLVASQCTSASEQAANAVELKFYRVTASEWSDKSLSSDVAIRVIDEANNYCANNGGQCGLTTCCTNKFKESMVVTHSGYPKNDLKDMLLKVSLDLPENSDVNATPSCVVPKSVVTTIIGNARELIHDDTGYWITYIDDEFFGIPPPTELNQIIIPIAVAVILILAILTVVLSIWNKRKEDELRRKRIIEQRKEKKKSPVYVVEKGDIKAPSGISGDNKKQEKPKRKDKLYQDGASKKSKKPASIASEDSAIKVDSDTKPRHAFGYENGASGYNDSRGRGQDMPLTGPPAHLQPIDRKDEDYERSPEKKKKKKKKRSKSREVMETTNEGFSAENSLKKTSVWDYSLQ